MNIDRVILALASAASLPYQERYIIHGTKEEYLTDVDLIEDLDSLRYLIFRPESLSKIGEEQRNALENMLAFIDSDGANIVARGVSREEAADHIRYSDAWSTLRSKASIALAAFGVDIESLSVADIDKMESDEDS